MAEYNNSIVTTDALNTLPQIDFTQNFYHTCREINLLSRQQLEALLYNSKKSTIGCIEVLRKRAKFMVHRSTELLPQADYLGVLDFECTCDNPLPEGFLHEIIEFPVILLNIKTLEVISVFHAYCRPSLNPILTKFCKNLTGVTQSQVDSAETLDVVLAKVHTWIETHVWSKGKTFAFATDGPWDFDKFLYPECKRLGIKYPSYCKTFVDVRSHYSRFYGLRGGISFMLEKLGKTFEGREHSGLDDARNITRIVQELILDGVNIHMNKSIQHQ